MSFIPGVRNRYRAVRLRFDRRADPRWMLRWEAVLRSGATDTRRCNICGWHGEEFIGGFHSEMAACPVCGAIARDRFLYWCWVRRTKYEQSARLLETSPRLDQRYRNAMSRRVDYLASDYDESAHKASIKLDLQAIDLPDASLDVVLTAHVLEHVADTRRALAELFRVVCPGGRVFLMVPMPQGATAPPSVPEFHGDNTLVYWRFGWDLQGLIEAAGFRCTILVTDELYRRVASGDIDVLYDGHDCDVHSLLSSAKPQLLTPIADDPSARRFGFLPPFHFIVWECSRPPARIC